MKNFNLDIILIALCAICGAIATKSVSDYRYDVFAEQGYYPMKPSKTLRYLRHLSDTYGEDGDSSKDKKEEIDNLIAISSEITEEKCNQEYVNHMIDMQIKYAPYQLNLLPYLLYNKNKLITDCANKFNIKDLNPQVTLYNRHHQSLETLEEKAAREAEEEKQRQYLKEHPEITLEEKRVRQAKIDEEWLQKFEEIFFKKQKSNQDIEEMAETFYSLYHERRKTSESDKIKALSEDIFELIRLNTKFGTCTDEEFKVYDKLIEKYSQKGFSERILEYINHYKLKFWQGCKSLFFNGQKPGKGYNLSFDDQVEVFSLVDHVLACISLQPWQIKDLQQIESGVIDYVHDKLSKKSHKKEIIDKLFKSTIGPTCSSVFERFRIVDRIGEIIANRKELSIDLDENSTKWLAAISICRVLNENRRKLQDGVFSTLYEQHQEAKGNTCLGKLFHKKH